MVRGEHDRCSLCPCLDGGSRVRVGAGRTVAHSPRRRATASRPRPSTCTPQSGPKDVGHGRPRAGALGGRGQHEEDAA